MVLPRSALALSAAVVACVAGVGAVWAQIEGGGRGVAAVDSSSDYEVGGIAVDTTGPDAEAARLAGWRDAQRKAWVVLSRRLGAGGGQVSDGTLDSLVSSIVVQQEQIGPNRYIARLGVLFDRSRTASMLGLAIYDQRSPPMLLLPVMWSGGTASIFEQRSAWQEAWARFRTSGSDIDYVRPAGNGADPLLLTAGQTQRPARGWWRKVLDQYGATDVLMPTVKLYRQWPGGPVIGYFEARHGPDNRLISRFALRVSNPDGIPQLFDAAVRRFDDLYQTALRSGFLQPDPGLTYTPPPSEVAPLPEATVSVDDPLGLGLDGATPEQRIVTTFAVQYDTPDAAAVDDVERALRSVRGVSAAATNSLALGGLSVASVTFTGPPEGFRAALEARGFQVFGSGTTLRIRRVPRLPAPDLSQGASPPQ